MTCVKRYCLIAGLAAFSMGVAAREGRADAKAAAGIYRAPARRSLLSGYLEIGTRAEYFGLRTSEKDFIDAEGERQTFLGSINRLEERQNLLPLNAVVAVTPFPWIGVELAWNSLRVRTRSFTVDPTDGDFVLSGPVLQLVLRYPNSSRVTPYGGIGVVFYGVDFDHADWWHRGYQSYEEWVARGRPKEYHRHYQRRFDPANTRGPAASAGCLVDVSADLAIDLYVRYVRIAVDNHWSMLIRDRVIDDRGIVTLPFSHYVVGIGARYRF